MAVPEGASTLSGWCSSMISTDSKYLAAVAANEDASTAPSAKLGAISTPVPGCCSSNSTSEARLASSQPVVPTTAWMPCSTANRTLASVLSGVVRSTTTRAPAETSSSRESPRFSTATSSRSGADSMAATASLPIRPPAPSTATASCSVMPSSVSLLADADPFGAAVGEVLFFPHRHLFLDPVHQLRARGKGCGAVRRRDGCHQGRIADRQRAGAVRHPDPDAVVLRGDPAGDLRDHPLGSGV